MLASSIVSEDAFSVQPTRINISPVPTHWLLHMRGKKWPDHQKCFPDGDTTVHEKTHHIHVNHYPDPLASSGVLDHAGSAASGSCSRPLSGLENASPAISSIKTRSFSAVMRNRCTWIKLKRLLLAVSWPWQRQVLDQRPPQRQKRRLPVDRKMWVRPISSENGGFIEDDSPSPGFLLTPWNQ